MRLKKKAFFWIKSLVHGVNIGFFLYLFYLIMSEQLGGDPVDEITHFTGIAAINTLFLTLGISPLSRISRQGFLLQVRRPLGLYCFFWASLHMLTYFSLDLAFSFSLLGDEIIQRPYLTIGAITWIVLLLLALTSTKRIQKFMGKKWQSLHNFVYFALLLALIHFYWSEKSEVIEPLFYLFFSFILLGFRWKRLKGIFYIKRMKHTL